MPDGCFFMRGTEVKQKKKQKEKKKKKKCSNIFDKGIRYDYCTLVGGQILKQMGLLMFLLTNKYGIFIVPSMPTIDSTMRI